MPQIFSVADPTLDPNLQIDPNLFRSQIATPTQDMATANSPGYGAAPMSQQPRGMGFMDWVGKIGDIMQSTGAGLQGRPDPIVHRRAVESEIQNRQQQLQLQKQQIEMAKQRQEFDKLKTGWDLIKELGDRAQFDESTAKATVDVMIGKLGLDPAWGGVFSGGLQNKSDREMLERLFPNAIKELGYPTASRIFKQPGAMVQLREMEKQIREADIKKRAYAVLPELKGKGQAEAEQIVAGLSELKPEDVASFGVITGRASEKELEEAAKTTGTDNRLAQTLFGKKTVKELSAEESDLLGRIQMLTPTTREMLVKNKIDLRTPEGRAKAEKLIASAPSEADQRKVNVNVNIAQQGAAAREKGLQSVLAQRIDRIRQEAEAAAGGKPLDASTQQRVSDLMSARRQVGNVEANYDKDFLGPIKGTQTAFETRRRIGGYIGTPLGEKETVFREALADIKDMLLRARSGAQINEQEYKRLAQMLPAATDEEQVFKAGLNRFDTELGKLTADKIRLGTTPRGQLGKESKKSDPLGIR